MVLEDDCEFNERIREQEIINDINKFLIEKDPMIYALGTFISFSSPINIITMRKHQLLLFTTGTHAVIYNDKYAKEAIKKSFMLGHADFEMNRYISKYTYYKPLAYQKVIETENTREGWWYMWPIINTIIIKPTGIDKNVQPGFDIIRSVTDMIVVSIFLIIIIKMKINKFKLNKIM